MEHTKIFHASNRKQWREYLADNYRTEKEVWFVFPTVDSGEKGVSYNDAVEEALCFGWIDSTAGKLDDKHGLRRFCPRRKGSAYSRPNIERLILLDKEGLLTPAVREEVADLIAREYVFPSDIIARIRADEKAWFNFERFSEPYKRIRVDYIEAARKRPEEFEKRMKNFLAKTRENKLIKGFGGIDKYYR